MTWQSIDTAPKDGTLIIGLDRNAANVGWMYPVVMKWDQMHWRFVNGSQWQNWSDFAEGPRLWAPVPPIPPEERQ
jgi:hypothetical protein